MLNTFIFGVHGMISVFLTELWLIQALFVWLLGNVNKEWPWKSCVVDGRAAISLGVNDCVEEMTEFCSGVLYSYKSINFGALFGAMVLHSSILLIIEMLKTKY